jgi:hypothetical protein
LSGVEPGENLEVALGAAMALLPGVGLHSLVWLLGHYALAVERITMSHNEEGLSKAGVAYSQVAVGGIEGKCHCIG